MTLNKDIEDALLGKEMLEALQDAYDLERSQCNICKRTVTESSSDTPLDAVLLRGNLYAYGRERYGQGGVLGRSYIDYDARFSELLTVTVCVDCVILALYNIHQNDYKSTISHLRKLADRLEAENKRDEHEAVLSFEEL